LTPGLKIYIIFTGTWWQQMDKLSGVMFFSLFIIGFILIILFIYLRIERRKKNQLKDKFRAFSKNIDLPRSDLRAVPRIAIPQSMEVVLSLKESANQGKKFFILDISLSGFLAEPAFSPKKVPSDSILKQVTITTPINHFLIEEIKLLRIEQRLKKNVVAFQILKIDEEQFEELKMFIKFLDKFLDDGT
jgi:hypothetical protein